MNGIGQNRLNQAIIITTTSLCLLGLALFSYLGVFNRYWADDWCYNADLKDLGFSGALVGYGYITTYAANRYSLTLFSGGLYPFGVAGLQAMTFLVIALWLGGLVWSFTSLTKAGVLSLEKPRRWAVLFPALVIFFSIYAAPHLYQSFYWRSGLLPYTAPLVLDAWIFGLLAHALTRERLSGWIVGGVAVLAFLAGGFSEAACAYLVTALGLLSAVAGLGLRRRQEWARRIFFPALAGLFSGWMAMLVLIASPTNAARLARYGAPAGLFQFPLLTLRFTAGFVRSTILDVPLPTLTLFFGSLFLALLWPSGNIAPRAGRHLWIAAAGICAAGCLLIAASYAPSAYIEQAPPALRTRIIARFTLYLALAGLGWLAGAELRDAFRRPALQFVALLGLALVLLNLGRTIGVISGYGSLYAQRAAAWDARDRQIWLAKSQNLPAVSVQGIDGAPVGGIRDIKSKKTNWVNNCAERYYGIPEIRADQP